MFKDWNLRMEFDIMGYNTGNELVEIDNDLLEIAMLFDNMPYDIKDKFWFCSKRRLINETKSILDSMFNLHDIRCLPEKMAKSLAFYAYFGLFEYDMIFENINNNSLMISPYKLPIKYETRSLSNRILYVNGAYFYSISLNKKNSKRILLEYIHELFHTQIDSHIGIMKDYLNREVFSIFVEKVCSLKLDKTGVLTRNLNVIRYQNLLDCIRFQDGDGEDVIKLEACVYLVSTLKAEKLYDLYINSNDVIKKEILGDIQLILDGKLGVEEFLEKYDITYDNSKNSSLYKKILIK